MTFSFPWRCQISLKQAAQSQRRVFFLLRACGDDVILTSGSCVGLPRVCLCSSSRLATSGSDLVVGRIAAAAHTQSGRDISGLWRSKLSSTGQKSIAASPQTLEVVRRMILRCGVTHTVHVLDDNVEWMLQALHPSFSYPLVLTVHQRAELYNLSQGPLTP